jgi:hypothetical protein
MEKTLEWAVDGIQLTLMEYARKLRYEDLAEDIVQAAKVRVIDTLGSLIGGFFAEPRRIACDVAASMPNEDGATVLGTRMKMTATMANGERLTGEAGGAKDELSAPKTDREIEDKFRMLCEEPLGVRRVDALLAQLWKLDRLGDVSAISPGFVIA